MATLLYYSSIPDKVWLLMITLVNINLGSAAVISIRSAAIMTIGLIVLFFIYLIAFLGSRCNESRRTTNRDAHSCQQNRDTKPLGRTRIRLYCAARTIKQLSALFPFFPIIST